ncbi:tripartite tricarboxylate transporter TctB family protein [Deinococcus psychrotolerans]|uniref:Tripartite tricarboxylate transporter TctB family protein n=1 Tax=Deinococcus psychrotolerans TaxID=2489213 RepID=A0A3G8YDI5_9DEIO|nr:tripartite tricarboxylate transporter TctB family protein [Deinococcus psychrotolerans]AZI42973.1 tripartite tricarboxylate transporter TctB family protein [Deinococcus psychrotolerans]
MTQPASPSLPTKPAISWPDLLVAVALTALGIWLFFGTQRIADSGMNTIVSPRVFPLIVSSGLTVLGLLLLVATLRGAKAEPAAEEDTDPDAPVNLAAAGIILGGFLIGALLLSPLGFVFGTALMYFSVAFAFGERRYLLLVAISLIVALITYLVFTRGLGLNLPPGILKGIL